MIFIGEKINGTRKSIATAIQARDKAAIEEVAKAQADAGADYLDVNAGVDPTTEMEDMMWLLDVVQGVTDVPICIDSSTPEVIKAAMEKVSKTPMINSVNADPARLDAFLPFIKEKDCAVIALAMDESKGSMPKDNDERKANVKFIFERTRAAGIADDKVFVDPLIMSAGTDQKAGVECMEMIRWIRDTYPECHITGGFSNISFGLPERKIVNRTFLTMAIMSGADAAVIDPTSQAILEALKATDLLMGNDRFCKGYTKAVKNGFTAK